MRDDAALYAVQDGYDTVNLGVFPAFGQKGNGRAYFQAHISAADGKLVDTLSQAIDTVFRREPSLQYKRIQTDELGDNPNTGHYHKTWSLEVQEGSTTAQQLNELANSAIMRVKHQAMLQAGAETDELADSYDATAFLQGDKPAPLIETNGVRKVGGTKAEVGS